ncbi:guanine deaminase [Coccomyxa subellipsoidea C-169]|uniref:Guanine deaminase n=1 Tax=Coccomyxa subellipsoidea (strain C-169) TaxID=574566 RepID=I0YNV9_COCSC|nr:guanine deaminase [Coccomyxa subellipsoidea C-169]EIE20078.1 guanine deaminase [Coccomyxa subellipsoidea C-169]|eukprot:XP_005644622.1 guanine deaminase [Coccomyxa subellipsoidea C-169]
MASFSGTFVLRGTFIHSPTFEELEYLEDHVCVVSSKGQGGKILSLLPASESTTVLAQHGLLESTVYKIPDGRFMCPGFVDTHFHAPQYSYSGTATDKPLMAWLDEYTFPRESRHQDLALARTEYSKLVQRLLSNGTTTSLYFASLHLEPAQLLAELLHQAGQRAYVGLVCMDRNSKDFYVKSLEQNLSDTEAFIESTRGLDTSLVHPVVTPRFVPTCSPELLASSGVLAQRYSCHIQSHISESLDNDALVAQLHPEVCMDTSLYDRAGMLTNRAVMAHGVTLTSAELALLAARGTAIAHCPLSNFFFADIPLDVLRCRQLGVRVGLGTDVAGGYSPSMLNAMRSAVIAAKTVRMLRTDRERLAERRRGAFWLATMGGAQALGLEAKIGSFEVGKEFDALMVDPAAGSNIDTFTSDTLLDTFQKFINLGDDRNIRAVWVQGGLVLWK